MTPAWGASSVASISRDAIAHNVGLLVDRADGAICCAVVKADGYGHGAVETARTALDAGASWLAVARVHEARVLRAAGIDAPVLLLSEPEATAAELDPALAMGLHVTAYRDGFLDALAERAATLGVPAVPVHLKVDTGMRRVGCEPEDVVGLARRIVGDPRLRLAGTMTHLAVADDPGNGGTAAQLDCFDAALARLGAAGIDPGLRHAANSAATLIHGRARYDLVRPGIAVYGIPPAPVLSAVADLRPAMRWTTRVSMVKRVRRDEGVSYGHRYVFDRDTTVATVPVGYADGLPRRLSMVGGEVLVRGRRRPMVGVITMDQFVIDVGPDDEVEVGDEVVLLGAQGADEITPTDVALALDTIGYEVTCAVSARVARRWE